VVQWVSVPEVFPVAPVLALCPAVLPIAFTQFLNPDHSIRKWLTDALPLVVASVPDETPVVQPAVNSGKYDRSNCGKA
jgi:hypothetical protein